MILPDVSVGLPLHLQHLLPTDVGVIVDGHDVGPHVEAHIVAVEGGAQHPADNMLPGVLLHMVKTPLPVNGAVDGAAHRQRPGAGVADDPVPLLHVRDRHAAKNAVVGGLPTSLRIEGGAVQHHQIPALLLPARQHRSVELPEIGVLIIELCGFHRRLLCVFFPIMPQTPPHCNAAYSASAASSSAVSPGCTASEMP